MGKLTFLKRSDVQPTVEQYCRDHSLSISKLEELEFDSYTGTETYCSYGIPSDVIPDGLMNDLATQPTPVLFVIRRDGALVIEETEHARAFFAG